MDPERLRLRAKVIAIHRLRQHSAGTDDCHEGAGTGRKIGRYDAQLQSRQSGPLAYKVERQARPDIPNYVVGWVLSDHLDSELVSKALDMAYVQRTQPKGVLFHSYQGVQLPAWRINSGYGVTGWHRV